jgi:serine/alanine adding enzyme
MEIETEISEGEWRDFIERTPGASIFQSPDMARVFRQTKGYHPQVVASLNGGSIHGLLASAIVSLHTGRLSRLSSRAIVIGGPIGNPMSFSALLAAHDSHSSRLALLTQIRNLATPQDLTPFASRGYRWEDHMNYVIDLRDGEGPILERMSKARRKGIASAEKAGVTTQHVGKGELDRAYELLQETHRRAEVPLADKSLFRSALEVLAPGDYVLGRAAVLGSEVCAARFVLRWNHTLYDWYAGSSDVGREVHADEWLVWDILREGVTKACTKFDFGGAGRPKESYGPGEFKRRFGGPEVNPGRFQKVYRPLTLKAAKVAYTVWRRLG